MAPLAVFGITNDGLNLAVNLLLLFLVVLWLALVYWTHADAKRRIADPMLVGCATAAALFPFVGTVVYMVVRPPEYLEDVHERELEIAAAEARLASAHEQSCPYCEYPTERSFLRCPSCLRRLKEPCTTCGKPLDPRWRICPYCEAEVAEKAPQRRRGGGGGQPARGERKPQAKQVAAKQAAPQPTTAEPRRQKRQAAPPASRPATSAGDREQAERRPARTAQAEPRTPAEPRTQAERPSGPPARQ